MAKRNRKNRGQGFHRELENRRKATERKHRLTLREALTLPSSLVKEPPSLVIPTKEQVELVEKTAQSVTPRKRALRIG